MSERIVSEWVPMEPRRLLQRYDATVRAAATRTTTSVSAFWIALSLIVFYAVQALTQDTRLGAFTAVAFLAGVVPILISLPRSSKENRRRFAAGLELQRRRGDQRFVIETSRLRIERGRGDVVTVHADEVAEKIPAEDGLHLTLHDGVWILIPRAAFRDDMAFDAAIDLLFEPQLQLEAGGARP